MELIVNKNSICVLPYEILHKILVTESGLIHPVAWLFKSKIHYWEEELVYREFNDPAFFIIFPDNEKYISFSDYMFENIHWKKIATYTWSKLNVSLKERFHYTSFAYKETFI